MADDGQTDTATVQEQPQSGSSNLRLNFGDHASVTQGVGYKSPNRELAQQIAGQVYTGQTDGLRLSEYTTDAIENVIAPQINHLMDNQGKADIVQGAIASVRSPDLETLRQQLNQSVALPEVRAVIEENFQNIRGEISRLLGDQPATPENLRDVLVAIDSNGGTPNDPTDDGLFAKLTVEAGTQAQSRIYGELNAAYLDVQRAVIDRAASGQPQPEVKQFGVDGEITQAPEAPAGEQPTEPAGEGAAPPSSDAQSHNPPPISNAMAV